MGVLLFVAAFFLVVDLALLAFVHLIVNAIRWKGFWSYISDSFHSAAHALDVFGNVAYKDFLNGWFSKGGYAYGVSGETISSATGRKWSEGSLTFFGRGMCGLVNFIDVPTRNKGGHCYYYIESNKTSYPTPKPIHWFPIVVFGLVSLVLLVVLSVVTYKLFRLL